MNPLPPGLVPKPTPATRANSLARVRETLDDLARPDNTDRFLLLVFGPEEFVHSVGAASGHDMLHMAGSLLQMSLDTCAPGSPRHRSIAAAMAALGATQVASYGGARPMGDGT